MAEYRRSRDAHNLCAVYRFPNKITLPRVNNTSQATDDLSDEQSCDFLDRSNSIRSRKTEVQKILDGAMYDPVDPFDPFESSIERLISRGFLKIVPIDPYPRRFRLALFSFVSRLERENESINLDRSLPDRTRIFIEIYIVLHIVRRMDCASCFICYV